MIMLTYKMANPSSTTSGRQVSVKNVFSENFSRNRYTNVFLRNPCVLN